MISIFRCCLGGNDSDVEGEWIWNDGTGEFSPNIVGYWSNGGLWAANEPNNAVGEDYACIALNYPIGLHDCYDNGCYPIWYVSICS